MTCPIPNSTRVYRGTPRGDRFEVQFNQAGVPFDYSWVATR